MKKTHITVFLLVVCLFGTSIVPAHAQKPLRVNDTRSTHLDSIGNSLEKYQAISRSTLWERRRSLRNLSATDKGNLWKVHLALYLAKHSKLYKEQKAIILGAISLANPTPNGMTPHRVRNTKMDEALRALCQRALVAFTKNEADKIFASVVGETPDDLLQKYLDISELPMSKRKNSFRNSSAQDKSELWKLHLALYLVKRVGINQAQQEVISEAISLASREMFELRSGNPEWEVGVRQPLRLLEGRILTVFSKQEGAEIFATLGDTEPVGNNPRASCPPPAESWGNPTWVNIRFVMPEQDPVMLSDCQCTSVSDWCWNYCAGLCNYQPSGCGTLWQYPCTGAYCH